MAEGRRKVREGRVVSDKMDKTVVVAIKWQQRHRLYRKSIRRVTNLYAHDKDNTCRIGDLVRVQETRPISSTKRWRVVDVLERKEVVDVKPIELNEGLLTEEQQAQEQREEDELDGSLEGDDETEDESLVDGPEEEEETP
jgi:small subunit ribosomal protein S17